MSDPLESEKSQESAPRLVAVDPAAPPRSDGGDDDRVARPVFLVVAALLGIAVIALLVQSMRVEGLSSQVAALEDRVGALTSEVESAGRQIEAYGMHRQLVQTAVGDLSAQVVALEALVGTEPEVRAAAPPETPEAP